MSMITVTAEDLKKCFSAYLQEQFNDRTWPNKPKEIDQNYKRGEWECFWKFLKNHCEVTK